MSNSSLVTYTRLSPNCNKPRNHAIDKITIHHMACNITVERCGEIFAPSTRQGSSNYGVDGYGHVGLYVDEANRAWTSGSAANDNRAVTIEVANDGGAPDWHVSDTAYFKMLDLVEDICRRNGIARLNFTGDSSGNLTLHKYFQATACPGPYLESKMPEIAAEINRRLAGQGSISIPVNVTYQGYDSVKKKWLHDILNLSDYAGNAGNAMSGVYVSADVGNIYYKVRTLKDKRWLPEVKNREDYAGILSEPFDAIMIRSDCTTIHYQVELTNGKKLPAVTGYSETDSVNGYAGLTGNQIAKLWIWADPIVKPVQSSQPSNTTPPQQDPPAQSTTSEPAQTQPTTPPQEDTTQPTTSSEPEPTPEPSVPSESDPEPAPSDPEPEPSDSEPAVGQFEESQLGDVNGDGVINNKDIVRLKNFLAGKDVKVFSGADVNGDGVIDEKDLTALKEMLANADSTSDPVQDKQDQEDADAIDAQKGKRTFLIMLREFLEKLIAWIDVQLQTKYMD